MSGWIWGTVLHGLSWSWGFQGTPVAWAVQNASRLQVRLDERPRLTASRGGLERRPGWIHCFKHLVVNNLTLLNDLNNLYYPVKRNTEVKIQTSQVKSRSLQNAFWDRPVFSFRVNHPGCIRACQRCPVSRCSQHEETTFGTDRYGIIKYNPQNVVVRYLLLFKWFWKDFGS